MLDMSIQQQSILVIGKSFKGLTDGITRQGYGYIILKDLLEARHPEKELHNQVLCDFSSKTSVLDTVDAIPEKIAGVITLYENYVLPAAWIADTTRLVELALDSAPKKSIHPPSLCCATALAARPARTAGSDPDTPAATRA